MAPSLIPRNGAVKADPPANPGPLSPDIHITARGGDWLWTVLSIDLFTLIIFVVWSYFRPRRDRIFHYITILIIVVTALCYYTLASDVGWMAVPVEWHRQREIVRGSVRQIFWIRYIDWAVTRSLFIMDLLLSAGIYWHTILYTIMLDLVYVLFLFLGAATPSQYKWGFFTLAILVLGLVMEIMIWTGIKQSSAIGGPVALLYRIMAPSLLILWILYPICWGISDAGNKIAPDSEQIFYGLLDVLSKPILCAVFLLVHTRIDVSTLDLRLYDRLEGGGNGGRTASFSEKQDHHNQPAEATAPPAVDTPAPAANQA